MRRYAKHTLNLAGAFWLCMEMAIGSSYFRGSACSHFDMRGGRLGNWTNRSYSDLAMERSLWSLPDFLFLLTVRLPICRRTGHSDVMAMFSRSVRGVLAATRFVFAVALIAPLCVCSLFSNVMGLSRVVSQGVRTRSFHHVTVSASPILACSLDILFSIPGTSRSLC